MKKFKSIEAALKAGHHLGCWSSGGRVPIAAIINSDNKTVAAGEGGFLQESFEMANKNFAKFLKGDKQEGGNLMTGAAAVATQSETLLEKMDQFVKRGYYIQVDWNYHSDVYVVFLESYNDDIEKVIQLAFNADLFKAIELAFAAPQVLMKKK